MNLLHHPGSGRTFLGPLSDTVHSEVIEADQLLAGTVIENVGMGVSIVRPSMDFETYSEAGYILDEITGKVKGAGPKGSKGGLPLVGTPVYAEHPSTEVVCLYYDLKDGKGRRAFIPGGPQPMDLRDHIANGGEIEAFNITFEWYIWNMVCVRLWGWPPLQLEQCHCIMARSRRFGYPGSLALAAKAIGTAPKDKAGNALIGKLCRPVSKTKTRQTFRRTPVTDWEDFASIYKYCDGDVKAEDEAAAHVPEMTTYERSIWLADQRINARGVQVDVEALDSALVIMRQMNERFTSELVMITGGAVKTVNEIAKIGEWLAASGCHMEDMTADSVKEALDRGSITGAPLRVLQIREALAGSNIKKLPTLKSQLSSDGRLRNQYMYCGASTGRWSAVGVQLQNLTSKGPKSQWCHDCGRFVGLVCIECPNCGCNQFTAVKDWTVEAVICAIRDINRRDLQYIIDIWGDPATVLAGCLRGLLIARKGYKFICCDFSAVEAVGLACLARCQWRIDVFNTHGKIYEMSASSISGVSFDEIMQYKKDNGADHPLRKGLGKIAELASGYGGWLGAWDQFGARDIFENDDEIKKAIIGWRDASPEIVNLWGGQHRQIGEKPWDSVPELFGLEGAAVAAILEPGKCFHVHDITYGVKDDILFCRLPSGRYLQYHAPRLDLVEGRFRKMIYKITFMGYNSNSKKGPIGWTRMETYGGRLAENVTQAVCADKQGDAIVDVGAAGYPVVMHTHDELIAEVPEDFGSIDEMSAIMCRRPGWGSWWPFRAAGWTHTRYQKD